MLGPLVFGPPGHREAAEAVGDQDHRASRLVDRQVEPVDPIVAEGVVRGTEVDPPAVAALVLPLLQPMARVPVVEPGNQEDERIALLAFGGEFEVMGHGRLS